MPFDATRSAAVDASLEILSPNQVAAVRAAIARLIAEDPALFPYDVAEHIYHWENCTLTFHWLNAEVVVITGFSWRK